MSLTPTLDAINAEVTRLTAARKADVEMGHQLIRMMQAAYAAGLRDGPEAAMQWLAGPLMGAGNCPQPGADPDWYSGDGWDRGTEPMPACCATVNEPAVAPTLEVVES